MTMLDVDSAAPLLSLSPTALRARLRRAARRVRGEVVADLGGGVVGVKLGKSWRIRVDTEKMIGTSCAG